MRKLLLILGLTFVLASCDKKNLPDVGATNAVKMANEWWVTFTVNGNDIYGLGHLKIATYNSSNGGGELWVDDMGNIWPFKVKANANIDAMTFSVQNGVEQNHPSTVKVTITDGKVITNGGHSKTGVITDSIYFKAEFSDDPGTVYTLSGHGRTRFAEDEY